MIIMMIIINTQYNVSNYGIERETTPSYDIRGIIMYAVCVYTCTYLHYIHKHMCRHITK